MSEPVPGPTVEELRALGYFLLPLPPRAKEPPPKGWKEQVGPYEIPADGNVAVAVGERSGGLAVLITNDDASTTWATGKFGPPTVRSKRGGHWWFKAPPGTANERNADTGVGQMELHAAHGKYVLVPTSIHPSGVPYTWGGGPTSNLPDLPDLRDLWHPGGTHHAQLLRMSAAKARDGADAGTIFRELASFRDAHLTDPNAHPERELRDLAGSAVAKFRESASAVPERPPADPETFRSNLERFNQIVKTKDPIHAYSCLIWAAHTHLVSLFSSTFYLGFKGKTGAGKGTAVESCIALTPNGEVLGETSEAYLASATDEGKAVGVEELDLLLERDRFIESLFRNGYRRGAFGGYKVPAKDGKGWVQAKRSLFGPKVYDTHVGASGHLLGRSIIVEMEPDDSVDRALDADLKAEALESVRTWLSEEAKKALEAWNVQRFRAHWRSPPFRARVRALQGHSGRDHVIGALLLATSDLMGWPFDSEIVTILAGRTSIEEEGAEAEVLDALRDLAPAPTPGTEVLFADLLARVNEARKKAGISKQFNRKSLASALAELGFCKGDGSDPRHDWYRTNVGPNRSKAVLCPARVLAAHAPPLSQNPAHPAHPAHSPRDVNVTDALNARDSGREGKGDPEDLLGPGPSKADRMVTPARAVEAAREVAAQCSKIAEPWGEPPFLAGMERRGFSPERALAALAGLVLQGTVRQEPPGQYRLPGGPP